MKIIKKGNIPERELTELTKVFEEPITCEICNTTYQPDLEDYKLTTNFKANSDGSCEYSLVGEVFCPVCNKDHFVFIRNLDQTVCSMMKKQCAIMKE